MSLLVIPTNWAATLEGLVNPVKSWTEIIYMNFFEKAVTLLAKLLCKNDKNQMKVIN